MCGRFAQADPLEIIAEQFGIEVIDLDLSPRYNVAPGQQVAVIIKEETRIMVNLKWGLVPFWAKDPSIGNRMINARAESVLEKPSFKNAMKKRRCLIPASGFYEWKKDGKVKVPHYFRLKSGNPFGLAGLWETWKDPGGNELKTFTIITTEPNELAARVHNRMPVIIPENGYATWLDIANPPEEAQALLAPYSADRMEAYPVSTMVNSPANDTEELVRPV
ncbi:MAG: SOS response-associated peptidase [Spirochaetota bacterium]